MWGYVFTAVLWKAQLIGSTKRVFGQDPCLAVVVLEGCGSELEIWA